MLHHKLSPVIRQLTDRQTKTLLVLHSRDIQYIQCSSKTNLLTACVPAPCSSLGCLFQLWASSLSKHYHRQEKPPKEKVCPLVWLPCTATSTPSSCHAWLLAQQLRKADLSLPTPIFFNLLRHCRPHTGEA